MRAVIYARFSSDRQREESIEGQIRECEKYAENKGIEVVGTYIDRALSATTDRRPDFQKIIRDSSSGAFDAVLCWKHDRFARNRYDAQVYKRKLAANHVRLLYATEDIPEGPSGIVLDSVLEGFAEYYSANLSENVKRGLYESARKRWTMGACPYGYCEGPDKRYALSDTAPVVRRIFEEYASGKPSRKIAQGLTREGYRTPRGKIIDDRFVARIIRNPKYYGLYEYLDIYDEEGIPPIVSRELWDRAQLIAEKHREAPALKNYEGGYILSGRLFCGECGSSMTAASGTGKSGRVWQYYACNGRRKEKNGCTLRPVGKKAIEDRIVIALRELVFSDLFIESAADYYVAWQSETDDEQELRRLRSQLDECERKIRNGMKSLLTLDSDFLREAIREVEEERTVLADQLRDYEWRHPKFTREQVLAFLRQFRNGDIDDDRWRDYLVRIFLERAYVFEDRVVLHLNITGTEGEVTLTDVRAAVEGFELGDDLPAKSSQFEHSVVLFGPVFLAILK